MTTSNRDHIVPTKHLRYRHLNDMASFILQKHDELPPSFRCALPRWLRQAARRHPRISSSLLFAITSSFVRNVANKQVDPSTPTHKLRDNFRWSIRIAATDHDSVTVGQLLSAMAQSNDKLHDSLRQVENKAIARFLSRVAASASGSHLSQTVNQFVNYLSQVTGHRTVPVRFDAKLDDLKVLDPRTAARASIRAFCDGSSIHLPICLASTQNKDLNQIFLVCYLTAHEFLHLAAGTFNFSFKSPRGRLLFRLLKPMRQNLKSRTRLVGITEGLRRKLRSEGVDTSALKLKAPPDLARFAFHFPNSDLAQWLWNACEDGRLEAIIRRRWPGLAKIHQMHNEAYDKEVISAPLASTSTENLINAIGMFAADRTVNARLTHDDQRCFESAKEIIREQRAKPRQSVYDSALTTRKLYLLLEKHFGTESLESGPIKQIFRPAVDAEEIAVRLMLGNRESESSDLRDDAAPQSDPDYKVIEPGIWLPEWDGRQLIEEFVHVKVHPHESSRQYPLLAPISLPFPNLNLDRSRVARGDNHRWHEDGTYLATELLAEYRVQQRAGFSDLQLHYDLVQTQAPLKVTLLFDLSISMEAARHCLGGDTPFARAIQAGVWIASNLEAQGAEVSAYGAIDGGPKLCQLFDLPKPVSRSIPTLRCKGAGGFRLGAFIRAIAQSPPELGMTPFSGRHVLLVLTDGDSGYLGLPGESVFTQLHKRNCSTCASRHRCKVEQPRGAINPRSLFSTPLFLSQKYAMGDIDCANHASPLIVKMLVFNDKLPNPKTDFGQETAMHTGVTPNDVLTFASESLVASGV